MEQGISIYRQSAWHPDTVYGIDQSNNSESGLAYIVNMPFPGSAASILDSFAAGLSDLAEVMLRDAVAELDRVRKRHAQVERLAKVWSAVDEVRLAVKPLAKTARREDRPAA